MSFLVLPPEINSAAMYSGAGSAPMLEAAAAWDGLASELGSAASSFSSVISGLAGQAWQGPASAAMTAAAAPNTGWLSAASGHASGAAGQARAVVSTFESTFASTVHPMAVAANRKFVRADDEVELVWAQRAGDRRNLRPSTRRCGPATSRRWWAITPVRRRRRNR